MKTVKKNRFPFLKTAYLAAACLLLLSGCTTQMLQLRPVSGDIAWIDGREVTRVEQNGVVMLASYEFEDARHVVLDVELKNRTSASIVIDPNDFYYVPFGTADDTLKNKLNSSSAALYWAADPEQKIQQAALDMKREKRRLVASSILNGVILVATVASDIKSSQKDKSWSQRSNSRYAHGQAYNFLIQKQIADINYNQARQAQLAHERENWQNLALRKTTLPTGESVRGLLFLPKDMNASYLLMNYKSPADSTLIPIKFAQEIIKARR